jgi:hypothetical protein
MTIVKQRKNIFVSHYDASGFTDFSQAIYVPFVPDEVIVKGVIWYTNGSNSSPVRTIVSNLIDEVILSSFSENKLQTSSHGSFKLNRPVSGNFSFGIRDFSGSVASSDQFNGPITIHLEFVKY